MISGWFSALSNADTDAAQALESVRDVPPPALSFDTKESEPVLSDWLSKQFPCPNVLLLAGPSQAEFITPLLSRKGHIRLLLLDRDPERLARTLNGLDAAALEEAVREGRLRIDPGESEKASMERFLDAADFSRVPRIRLLDARPLPDTDFEMALEMTKAARELIRFQACDVSTRMRFGRAWQEQTIRNLPHILRHAGVRSLENVFPGRPALIVAAGPSLDEAVPFIRDLRDRFVVVSVGRVLTHLIRRCGIVPDLVVTGDGQSLVKRHFQVMPPNVPVVASCFTAPELMARLDRVFFMEMESMRLPEWLRATVGEQGEIFPGGNVSTAAMSVAVKMGCNPVLTVGFDLSYPDDGKTHATRRKTKGFIQGVTYYDVPGNYQATVKTNRPMRHYIDFAEEFVADRPETDFVNVNTGGARITGMRLVRPEEMESFAGTPFEAARLLSDVYEGETRDPPVNACLESLNTDVPRLQSLRRQCLEAAMVCNRLIMLMRRPNRVPDPERVLREGLDQLAPVDERLKTDSVMNLIEARIEHASHYLAERMMTTDERNMAPAVRSYRRWRAFYESVAEACRETETLVKDAICAIKVSAPAQTNDVTKEHRLEPVKELVS